VYSNKGRAEVRRSLLTALGFESDVAAQTKTRERYWLNVHMASEEVDERALIQTAARVAPHSQLSLSACSATVSQGETVDGHALALGKSRE
jgi:hypothetical protein